MFERCAIRDLHPTLHAGARYRPLRASSVDWLTATWPYTVSSLFWKRHIAAAGGQPLERDARCDRDLD